MNHPTPAAPPTRIELALLATLSAGILAVGVATLAFTFFHLDMSWLTWAASRLLDGGDLYRDVVEMNAPLTMVLNVVPEMFTRGASLHPALAFDIFVILTLILCFLVAHPVLRVLEVNGAVPPLRWFYVAVLAVILVLPHPFKSWGQREFLTVWLTMPYLALIAARCHALPVSRPRIIMIAVLCAVGIGMKPYFALPFAAFELQAISCLGFRRAVARLELLIVMGLLVAYVLVALVVWPEYFHLMLGLDGLQAYAAVSPRGKDALLHLGSLFGVLALLTFAALPRRSTSRVVHRVLAIAMAGFLTAAILQQKAFDYHYYPTLALGTLLVLLILSEWRVSTRLVTAGAAFCLLFVCAKMGIQTLRTARVAVGGNGSQTAEFIDILQPYGRGVKFVGISTYISPFFPAVSYTDAYWLSPFSNLWPLFAAYEDQKESTAPLRYHTREEMGPLERYAFDRFIETVVAGRPAIIVLRRSIDQELYTDGRFDLMRYFSQDPRFRGLMAQYELMPFTPSFYYFQRRDLKAPPGPVARRMGHRWSSNCYRCLE